MKKLKLVLASLLLGASLQAQTNVSQIPNLLTNLPVPAALGQLWSAIAASDILQATNYSIAPYLTYASAVKASDKVGGGLLAIYNVNSYVGAAMGVDWLGQFSLVSGNVTLKADIQPFKQISFFSFLPDTIKNAWVTPFTLLGIGQPMGNTTVGAATVWDVGASVKFGHWLGGNFGVGATWGEWQNAGNYSGHREHLFLEYQKGF
ncbi:MAG: hypothetical protein ACLPYZ_10270 [Limisphaerales bacterium]